MPYKNGHLTAKERAFVQPMARTGDAVYAATKAGYSSPEQRGPELARKLKGEVVRHFKDLIVTELLPLAFDAHKRLLTEKTTPPGALNQAVKGVYDQAFADDADLLERDLSEMTLEELDRKRRALEREREARPEAAKIIDATHSETGVFD